MVLKLLDTDTEIIETLPLPNTIQILIQFVSQTKT